MSYSVTCLTTLKEAQAAWELLSPHENLMDEWDYRYLYFKHDPKEVFFYQLSAGGTPVALLPLQKNDDGFLEFFGGNKFYRNSIFITEPNPDAYKFLFAGIHEKIDLRLMNEPIPGVTVFEEETGFYVLDLNGFSDRFDYLDKAWHGKSKKNIKSQMKKLEALGISVVEDDPEDLDVLSQFNLQHFGEHSHFHKPHRLECLKELQQHFQTKIVSLRLGGKTVAAGFSMLFNNRYYGLTSGHDMTINNIGKCLILHRIEQAIRCGAEFYEAGRHDYGWKEQFHFEKKKLYHL
jgi:CelD/BcsL family acetyltransferase involved in cellulose biosynthesis